jgi:hypothetical protein
MPKKTPGQPPAEEHEQECDERVGLYAGYSDPVDEDDRACKCQSRRAAEPQSRRASRTHRTWSVVLRGVGLAVLGHALAIAVLWIPAKTLGADGPEVDLDAGGRAAVAFFIVFTYAVAHLVLLIGVVVGYLYGPRRFEAGLVGGWASGWALIVVAYVSWIVVARP